MSSGTGTANPKVSNDLSLLAPLFRAAVERAILQCNNQGLDAMVFEAYRSPELQALYYARGRTQIPPTRTVTNAPTNLDSWHGYGLAVDVISRSRFWDAGDEWFRNVAAIFKANECKWGGDWTKPDLPHFQWHRCKPSPSDIARNLIRTLGAAAVWDAVGAATEITMPPPPPPSTSGQPTVPPPALRTARVTAAVLNLRPDPSTMHPPLAQLTRGTPLEVIGQQGSWFKVRVAGKEGFVHADLVSLSDTQTASGFLRDIADLQAIVAEAARSFPVPPSGGPRLVAQTWNMYGGLLDALCQRLRIPPAAAVAVLCTESSGNAFTNGKLTIRFEVHQFHNYWGRNHQEEFNKHFKFDPNERHKNHLYSNGTEPFAPFHGKQESEWRVFNAARALDNNAAVLSISMGLAQVMGFNYETLGYKDPAAMLAAMESGIRPHIIGMFDYIKGRGSSSLMVQALQNRNYEAFATRYNGPGQVETYGKILRTYAQAFEAIAGT